MSLAATEPARDRIEVAGIRAWGRHGVLAEETTLGQQFVVDVALHVDTAAAGRSDRLERTVNYAEVARIAREEIEGEPVALVETLAERLAARVLRTIGDPLVRRIEVAVHKPAAPVGLPVDDVRLRIVRDAEPVDAVLAVGTNLGDRESHLARALELLERTPGIEVDWTSPVVETDPVGGVEQDAFLNAVIGVRTALSPFALLAQCQRLEQDARRERLVRWGPRTLDVDVIAYGAHTSEDEELTLPHPRAHERAFVLEPWRLARPGALLPGHGEVAALAAAAPDRDGLRPGPAIPGYARS